MPNIWPRAQLPLLLSPLCSTSGGKDLYSPCVLVTSLNALCGWCLFTNFKFWLHYLVDIWLLIQTISFDIEFSGGWKVQIGKSQDFSLSQSIKLLWVGWSKRCPRIFGDQKSNGYCWHQYSRTGGSVIFLSSFGIHLTIYMFFSLVYNFNLYAGCYF